MHKLDVRREDSAGVLLLVVPDGMIFPNGDAKNYTSVPVSSLLIGRAFQNRMWLRLIRTRRVGQFYHLPCVLKRKLSPAFSNLSNFYSQNSWCKSNEVLYMQTFMSMATYELKIVMCEFTNKLCRSI